jgi:hypothetical protein
MVVETDDETEIMNRLITDDVSTNGGFYLAEVTGEHPKYGLDRAFVTDKRSPYHVDAADLIIGTVYELKAEDSGVRVYFQWNGLDDGSPDMTVLDEGDNVDTDAILEVVNGADAESMSVRQRAHEMVDDADTDELETLLEMFEDSDFDGSSGDPGEIATVDLSDVPTDVRKNIQLYKRSFSAAFNRHTGDSPSAGLLAIAIDAGAVAERNRGDN